LAIRREKRVLIKITVLKQDNYLLIELSFTDYGTVRYVAEVDRGGRTEAD
jgi:hypothetical protein